MKQRYFFHDSLLMITFHHFLEGNEHILMKEDLVSIYEKRCNLNIPKVSEKDGITLEILNQMSLFIFHTKFFNKAGSLYRKKKASMIIFKPHTFSIYKIAH